MVRGNFGGSELGWAAGNFGLDNGVDAYDLATLRTNIGFGSPPAVVPEPTGLALLVIGSLTLAEWHAASMKSA